MTYDRRADRLIGIVAGAVVVLAILAGLAWALTRGSDEEGVDATRGPLSEDCELVVRQATLALRGPAIARLADAGATVAAVAPASNLGDGAAALPLADAASVDCPLATGRIATDGGLRFDVAGQASEITGVVVDFDEAMLRADVRSADFAGRIAMPFETGSVEALDRGEEVVYVLPVNVLSSEAGTLDDALQKAALSQGDLATDSTLTIVGAKVPAA